MLLSRRRPASEPDAEATAELEAAPEAVPDEATEASASPSASAAFVRWMRARPFIGGLITILAGVALFFSSQLDLGNMHVQVGVEGMQATLLPVILALAGLLGMLMPGQRIFYGVIALVVSVYSLVAVNLGGFFVGFLLGSIGGVVIVSWMPGGAAGRGRRTRRAAEEPDGEEPDGEASVGEEELAPAALHLVPEPEERTSA